MGASVSIFIPNSVKLTIIKYKFRSELNELFLDVLQSEDDYIEVSQLIGSSLN